MDSHRVHKHSRLPRTSRVNEKVIEYYTKFGQDRDLEKFMRLYSPGFKSRSRSSNKSNTTSSSCGEDETQCMALRRLFMLNNPDCESVSGSSKSLPSIELCGSGNIADCKNSTVGKKANEHIIPIHLEDDRDNKAQEKVEKNLQDILITPKKIQNSQSKQTQTPDSVAKSHKRLEWDSLGDVGYRKSMSTSNISILERSLLREFFQETPAASIANKKTTNTSEGDLKQLQREKLLEREIEHKTFVHSNHNTPPLASSTFVDAKLQCVNSAAGGLSGTRPKYTTQGTSTSTSLLKKYEKFVQTSLTKQEEKLASKHSKEIQVNMSSATPSIIGSSATPSSFEYCGSSHSNTNSNNDGAHPLAADIAAMLLQRKALKETNKKHKEKTFEIETVGNKSDLQNLTESLTEALNVDNKENSSLGMSTKTPQLDLGIQLLCSLIDARSLNKEEKKHLVRDIVKRISRLSGGSEQASKGPSSIRNSRVVSTEHSTTSSVGVSRKGSNQSIKNVQRDNLAKDASMQNVNISESEDNAAEQLIKTQDFKKPSPPTTSAKALKKQLPTKQSAEPQIETLQATAKKDFDVKNELDKLNKDSLIDVKLQENGKVKSLQKHLKKQIKNSRQTISSTSTTSSSKDLTTQKELNVSTDADATMGEWLNPLTQSEIEYERKKLESATKKREKLLQYQKKILESDKERETQLNWIEMEIQRLESLKHLLLKVDLNDESTDEKHSQKNQDLYTQKIYDTVHSSEENQGTSSILSESAERLVQEIEVIIEESNEDVINLAQNLKRTKEHKKETQIIYDKPTADEELGIENTNKARFRSVKETITINEEQVLPSNKMKKAKAPVQRSKIDTPSSNDSESVCSFVKQRKREFLEHYKNIKKTHYEALLQQQQQHQEHHQEHINQHLKPLSPGVAPETASGHYSVPQTMPRIYPVNHHHHAQMHPQNFYNHIQPYHHHLPPRPAPPPPPPPPVPPHVIYTASAGLTSAQSNTHNINTNSSSSMFCISSEISIPMGSNTTSSTTTTTHQYDDVAAGGVGIQTSDSMLRSRPIFGRRQKELPATDGVFGAAVGCCPSGRSISVQIKPKSIAYVISFDAKTNDNVSPITQTTTSKSEEALTLQDYLQRAKPKFCAQSKERKAILNHLQALRQERERELRAIVDNTSMNSLDRRLMRLPPPPTKHTRIFPTKEMKAMTNKHYALLPEVLDKQEREREERRKRSNRMLRDVFNKRLQNRVRNGKLSLNHSKTVI